MNGLSARLRFAIDRAGRFEEPHFGQFALWVILAAGAYALSQISAAHGELHGGPQPLIYAFYLPIDEPVRHTWISFLSFLPFRILHAPEFFRASVVGYHVAAAAWFLQLGGRWAGVAAAVFYTAALSLFWEHGAAVAEWWNLVGVMLILFAGWYWLLRSRIRQALRAGEFWRRQLFPLWTRDLAVFSVAWFFFQAGASKLLISGPSWADGTNLQLAVHRFVLEWNELVTPFVLFILRNRDYATWLSAGVLLLECSALLAAEWTCSSSPPSSSP